MHRVDSINNLDILKHIMKSSEIKKSDYYIIITGRVGPTGKTWLCQELLKCGYRAYELSPVFYSIHVNDDGANHMFIDEHLKQVVIVLNEILPMYWNKGFDKPFDQDEDVYTFGKRSDAHNILNKMLCIANLYGTVTRGDFMDMVGMNTSRGHHDYGWTANDIRKTQILKHQNGYFIEFPEAKYLG